MLRRQPRARRPEFSAEVLALFARCEAVSRGQWAFTDAARELARQLDLVSEFWSGNTPLDRASGPCHPKGYAAHQDWYTCRRIRMQLLAALAGAPADASDRRGPSKTALAVKTHQ